jgi:hypothetical protein
VLLAVVMGGLVFLVGSTVLAVRLAARSDSRQAAQAASESGQATESTGLEPRSAEVAYSPTVGSAPEADRPDRLDDPGRAPPSVDLPPAPGGRPPELKPPGADAPGAPPPGAPKDAPASERTGLPREMQTEVNKAIDKGVAYLKRKQHRNGAWENQHMTAYAALPALTLLECGVPASDPRVQKAAGFVRNHVKHISSRKDTYELSLALLFLDRLGEEKDRPIIRSIALRLVAGQNADGGWTYTLPELTKKEENDLEKFLQNTRPQDLGRLVQLPGGQKVDPSALQPGDQKPLKPQGTSPGQGSQPGASQGNQSGGQQGSGGNQPGASSGGSKPIVPPAPKKDPERKKPLTETEARKAAQKLPPKLHMIPAVVDAVPGSVRPTISPRGPSDNSNTQFATLALWAATRYDLPLERSLHALARRFQNSQAPDGTWKYHTAVTGWATPAMTGAGLLGLAVGHGVSAGTEKVKDPLVEKGFRALAVHIGKPFGADRATRLMRRGKLRTLSPINMYLLWTIERVGVLYGVRTLDGKDWYRWGAELLLDCQKDDGSWEEGNYHGFSRTLDTCLALLFLKRANLATDLTRKLEFVIDGKSAVGASGSLGPP